MKYSISSTLDAAVNGSAACARPNSTSWTNTHRTNSVRHFLVPGYVIDVKDEIRIKGNVDVQFYSCSAHHPFCSSVVVPARRHVHQMLLFYGNTGGEGRRQCGGGPSTIYKLNTLTWPKIRRRSFILFTTV